MKIICTQIQDGGRTHEIDGINYHFKHDEAIGAQVCEVTEQSHIDRFLSITDAFYECQTEINLEPVINKQLVAPAPVGKNRNRR